MSASAAILELQTLTAAAPQRASRRLPGAFGLVRDSVTGALDHMSELVLETGQVLFTRGTPCDSLLIVASGSLTVGTIDEQLGTFTAQRTFWPGDAYGSHAYLAGATHSVDGVAAQPTRLLEVPRDDYLRARELGGSGWEGFTSGALRRVLWDLSGGRFDVPGLLDLVESFDSVRLTVGSVLKASSFPNGCWALVDEGSLRYGERVVVAGEDVGLDSALVGMAPAVDLLATEDCVLRICDGETLKAVRHVHPLLDVNLHRRLLAVAAQCERRPLLATVDRNAEPPAGPPERIELSGGTAPSRFARLPHRRQQEPMDCGAACLSMVSTFHGLNVPYRSLLARTSASRFGSSLLDLARAAEALGFIATGMKATWNGLRQMDLPAIAHLPNDKHFVVVWRVTKDAAIVGDPGLANKTMPRAEFEAAWNGALLSLRPTAQLIATQGNSSQAADRTPIAHLLPILRAYSGTLWELTALFCHCCCKSARSPSRSGCKPWSTASCCAATSGCATWRSRRCCSPAWCRAYSALRGATSCSRPRRASSATSSTCCTRGS
jgi:ATP-binding cassette, subfamily B, bacterial HlyB/CyaB